MTEPDRIVCIPASREPHVPSTIVECGDCRAPLWRSNASLEQDLIPICESCLPPGGKPAATTTQIRELAEAWDSDPLTVANYLASIGVEIV